MYASGRALARDAAELAAESPVAAAGMIALAGSVGELTGAVVTPEAAVFDRLRALAYHGRIDDEYVSLGVERPSANRHDLADALAAVVAGHAPAESTAPAVGCYIADFVP